MVVKFVLCQIIPKTNLYIVFILKNFFSCSYKPSYMSPLELFTNTDVKMRL